MHPNSMFGVLAALGLAAATPIDHSLEARGITPSKPGDIKCEGEIIGYRTVALQDDADWINTHKTFPAKLATGSDLGRNVVYFSDGFGDYGGGSSQGVHWCVGYAKAKRIEPAQKVWIPENNSQGQCIRYDESLLDEYIKTASGNKFTPSKTLRFAPMQHYLQMAVPHEAIKEMKVCGKCYPIKEAQGLLAANPAEFPRIKWQTAADYQKNKHRKRDTHKAKGSKGACSIKKGKKGGKNAQGTTAKGTNTHDTGKKGKKGGKTAQGTKGKKTSTHHTARDTSA